MDGSKPIDSQWPRGKLFGAHLPPPIKGTDLFSRTPVYQTFFDTNDGHRGFRTVLHYERSMTNIFEYFVEHV